jgi:hypothetical protein
MGSQGKNGLGHPNDPDVIRAQLANHRLTLTEKERRALVASIEPADSRDRRAAESRS